VNVRRLLLERQFAINPINDRKALGFFFWKNGNQVQQHFDVVRPLRFDAQTMRLGLRQAPALCQEPSDCHGIAMELP
jgi:hypothetical protein